MKSMPFEALSMFLRASQSGGVDTGLGMEAIK